MNPSPTFSMRTQRARAHRHALALRAPIARCEPGWLERRACNTAPPAMFFGKNVRLARQICDTCPVRMSCLADAHTQERELPAKACFGIRGGLTPEERERGRNAPETVGVAA